MSVNDWPEKDYRLAIKDTFDRVDKIYSEIDPDVLEVEQGLGTLVLQNQKAKIILSTQPSVRQLWLAAAHVGRALHFNYDLTAKKWMDDKSLGIELYSFLDDCVKNLIRGK